MNNSVGNAIKFAFEEEINGIEIAENSNGEVVVSSLQVAKNFGKEHKNVIQTIEGMKAENSALINMFFENTYKVEGNRKTYKCYYMNRDGFSLLVMGFTGKKALDWKLRYIEAFNLMEQKLKERLNSGFDDISPQLQYLIQMERRQNELEKRQNELEKKIDDVQKLRDDAIKLTLEGNTINTKYQKYVSNAVKRRCVEICGTEQIYNAVHRKIAGYIYSDIQRDFGVGSYRNLTYGQLQDVLCYIANWEADMRVKMAITRARKAQIQLNAQLFEILGEED